MSVVPLTLTISLCLVFTFVMFFLREHARGSASSAERDSLLPLAEESSRLAHASRAPMQPRTTTAGMSAAPTPVAAASRAE
jgi:hypothetical protein